MGRIIAIANQKGGVGKTTTSINLSASLAAKGKKVLVIDTDPQGNTTSGFGIEKNELEDTIYELILGECSIRDCIISNVIKNVSVVPSNVNLAAAEIELIGVDKKEFILKNEVDYVKDDYDFIIIDCPPTLTIYTDSALMASDYYLIPNRIDRYSIVGIDSLQKAVTNLIREERIKLRCLGLVYTMVNTNMSVKQQKIKDSFESKKTVNDIDIFDTHSTIVNDIQVGASGSLPTKYKRAREDMEAISVELLRRIKLIEQES